MKWQQHKWGYGTPVCPQQQAIAAELQEHHMYLQAPRQLS
jgi:hypothetical protein